MLEGARFRHFRLLAHVNSELDCSRAFMNELWVISVVGDLYCRCTTGGRVEIARQAASARVGPASCDSVGLERSQCSVGDTALQTAYPQLASAQIGR